MQCSRALLVLAFAALAAGAVVVRGGWEGRPHRLRWRKGSWGEQACNYCPNIPPHAHVCCLPACLPACRRMPPAPTLARPPRRGGQLGSAWERRQRSVLLL